MAKNKNAEPHFKKLCSYKKYGVYIECIMSTTFTRLNSISNSRLAEFCDLDLWDSVFKKWSVHLNEMSSRKGLDFNSYSRLADLHSSTTTMKTQIDDVFIFSLNFLIFFCLFSLFPHLCQRMKLCWAAGCVNMPLQTLLTIWI